MISNTSGRWLYGLCGEKDCYNEETGNKKSYDCQKGKEDEEVRRQGDLSPSFLFSPKS
jgi:hypothetical protein